MKRCAVLISGGGSNMMTLVGDMTGDHPARPVLVLSNRPDAGGLAKAAALGIPTAVVDHRDFPKDREAFEAELNAVLERGDPDIICLAGFMRVLTPVFVDRWAGRILNIHPSLLPKYPGLNTHARAIQAGDKEAGCSVHEVTDVLDGGPILGQARVPILEGDTSETLAARVLIEEHRLYPAVLRRFAEGDRRPIVLSTAAESPIN
ncbi:phosphoribosylglycinamide formyltransferase [Boseongicola aestuarii]|uniref:Phosphoribosylglycinamide formyltransferase n=1 Tax=Boseongicola aestuarii TaxID=1470561 RepID=A0A238IVK9_9RHOB|nr:phosphoribosylglycinamide formyltransferase [Boseongicola aestuarii]SMX22061.1 Phosphoribosylglycinamide formyltransferase [Boseongicola aestuarii]